MNNDVKITFSSNIEDFSKKMAEAQKNIKNVNTTLTGISKNTASTTFRTITEEGNKVIRMSQRFSNATNKITGWTISVKDAGNEVKTLGSVLSNVNAKMVAFGTAAYASISKVYNSMKKYSTDAINQSEALNLFNVVFKNIEENGVTSFSNIGKEADNFQKKLKNNFGADSEDSYTYQALYQSMARSQGISEEAAKMLSENTTEMVYDLSSLFNRSQDDVAEALRAGIYAGQTKPLRSLGVDITETSLQATLDKLKETNEALDGLKVSTMSQAEKQILRYITVLKQAGVAQGDYANTIESPANQLKILENQLAMTGAAIGNLLIVPFQKLLQVVNAVIIVIRYLAEALASLFGISAQDFNTGKALAPLGDEAEDVADGFGEAAKKADELKKETLGFDQINNINTDDNKSGDNVGINQALIDSIGDWQSGLEETKLKAQQIAESIMKWLGFTYDEIDGIWKLNDGFQNIYWVAGLIGTILGSTIFTNIFKIVGLLGKITGISSLESLAGLLPIFSGILLIIGGVIEAFKALNDFIEGDTVQGILHVIASISLVVAGIAILCGAWLPALIAGIIALFAMIGAWFVSGHEEIEGYFDDIWNSFNEKIIQPITDWLTNFVKWILDNVINPIIDFFTPVFEAIAEVLGYTIGKVKEIASVLFEAFITIVSKLWEILSTITQIFLAVFKIFYTYIVKPIMDIVIKVGTWLYNTFAEPIFKIFAKVRDYAIAIFKGFTMEVVNFFSGSFKLVFNAIFSLIERTVNGFIKMINAAVGVLNNVPGVEISKISEISLPRFAGGGFPEEGPFMMNRGEMAGKFSNGKSVVANNEQITEGIKRAVLSGMNEALANNQSNVKLDIRTEEGIIVKKAINGINQITRSTGESPLAW